MRERTARDYACWIAAIAFLVLILAGAAWLVSHLQPMRWIDFVLNRNTQPLLFIALFAVLPVFGFPMTLFLVLVGVKFGILWGILLTALVMPVHMAASYALAKSLFYKPLRRFLAARGHSLPDMSNRRVATGMLVFLALPGPSYAMKNYLLALVDIPFLSYLGLNACIQGLLVFPIIGLSGAAAAEDWSVFSIFALAVVILVGLRWHFKRKRTGLEGDQA